MTTTSLSTINLVRHHKNDKRVEDNKFSQYLYNMIDRVIDNLVKDIDNKVYVKTMTTRAQTTNLEKKIFVTVQTLKHWQNVLVRLNRCLRYKV